MRNRGHTPPRIEQMRFFRANEQVIRKNHSLLYLSNHLLTNLKGKKMTDFSNLPSLADLVALEEMNMETIYGDNTLRQEFLGKRKRLLDILNQEGYNILGYDLLDPNFSLELDQFLFSEIGYPNLTSLTMGLFVSPYGITSLSEYFANGFEKYLMKFENRKYLKNISPFLHTKIEEVIEGE